MKTTVFTLATMGLGLMAGITITHHHQVNEMVAQEGVDKRIVSASVPVVETVQPASKTVPQAAPLVVSDIVQEPRPDSYHSPRTEREDALLELLAEMRKEQKRMHQQMAEQNRELAELTFRVDTHSDSFKPLRTDSSQPRSLGTPAAPQVPIGDDEGLLPPKPSSRLSP